MKKPLFFLAIAALFLGGCSGWRGAGYVSVGGYYGYNYPVYQQTYQSVRTYYPLGVPCCTFPIMGYGPGYFTPGPGGTYSPYNFTPITPGNSGYIIHQRNTIR
ncbi:MAG: hypothetical protein WC724_03130 [Candidatus Paceibacterota bacterium]|jgi:hypothetical protein